MAEHCTDSAAPSAGGGGDPWVLSLLWFRFTGVMEWDLKPFLVSSVALLLCFREFGEHIQGCYWNCALTWLSLIPITHRCQVEIITLNRNNWPESKPSRKNYVFKRKKTFFLGSSFCRAASSGWGCAPRDPEPQVQDLHSCLTALPVRDHGRSESPPAPHQQWSNPNYTTSCLSIQDYRCGI